MAKIPRPPKQGNTTSYVDKVAAGYTKILAGEIDADFDTIYDAWNTGTDTANLKDGSVTGAKLAADAVGPRELADGAVFTNHLQDLVVTTPKLHDGAVTTAKLATGAVTAANLAPGAVGGTALAAGSVGAAQIVDGSVGTGELADAAVTRAKLAPAALPGAKVLVAITSFQTAVTNQWIRVATLPALTTRGANPVFLFTSHCLTAGTAAPAGILSLRWIRDGTPLISNGCGGADNSAFPVPTLPFLDIVPAAGSYVYALEVFLGTGVSGVFLSVGQLGGLFAFELG